MDDNGLFRRAILYIYDHIDEPFTSAKVARALNTSQDTLEREFMRVAETTPAKLIRRLRFELAFRTLQDRNQSVLQVALSSGYSDHSAFSRSFRDAFGFAPKTARTRKVIQRDLEHVELEEPEIVEVRDLDLQYVEEKGTYFDAPTRAWEKLETTLSATGIDSLAIPLWVGQALDDPHHGNMAPNRVRFRAAVEVQVDLGLSRTALPKSKYARFAFTGKINNLGLAYHYIYGPWAQSTDLKLAEKPALVLFCEPPASAFTNEVRICVPLKD